MAVIKGLKDTLNAEVARFEQAPLKQPVLVNSVPKGGTHLLRNIPAACSFRWSSTTTGDFVQIPNMHLHLDAFNPHAPIALVRSPAVQRSVARQHPLRPPQSCWFGTPTTGCWRGRGFFVSEEFEQENIQQPEVRGVLRGRHPEHDDLRHSPEIAGAAGHLHP
ncbi:MAG: hypothetical protein KL785_04410 [Brevundimonas sp.]|nr:hypothetical protein [Brevundimonas sp.]